MLKYSYLFLLCSLCQYAQEDQLFKLSNHLEGKLFEEIKDLKKHSGSFQFETSKKIDTFYISHQYQGFIAKGAKSDNWQYTYQKYQPSDKTILKNNVLQTLISGNKIQLKATFEKDLAEGYWQYQAYNLNESKEILLKSINAKFKKGHFIEQIHQKSDDFSFEGQFDINHFFTGLWRFHFNYNNQKITEERLFDNGKIVSHIFFVDNDKIMINYSSNSNENANENIEDVNLSEETLQIIRMNAFKTDENNLDNLLKKSDEWLISSFNKLRKNDHLNIWHINHIEPSFFMPKLKLIKYNYPPDEKDQLFKIISETEKLNKDIDSYLSKEYVVIHKNTDENLAKYEKIISVYKNWLSQKSTLIKKIKDANYNYIPKDFLLKQYFPPIEFSKQLTANFKDKTIAFEHIFPHKIEEATLNDYLQVITFIAKDVKDIITISDKIMAQNTQLNALKDKEARMLVLKDEALNYISINKEETKIDDKILSNLNTLIQKTYEDYLYLSLEDKKNKIEETLNCFSKIEDDIKKINDIKVRHERLKQLYTRTIWNAFTMTDMHEIMKPRVFSAYEKLYNHDLQNLNSSLNCQTIEEISENYNKLYIRMIDLHEEDTKDIEQKLRRENNIDKIKTLLNYI